MKFYVGITDNNWFNFLSKIPSIDEVNFWQPSPDSQFQALKRGELFLFKLHRSKITNYRDLIAGGGVFVSFSILPISFAWDTFGNKNGAGSYDTMRRQIVHYRRVQDNRLEDFQIGCIILTQPFFFDESEWFTAPEWSQSIVRGKGYDLDSEAGQIIWKSLSRIWEKQKFFDLTREARRIDEEHARYGKETIFRPRLGQSAFKAEVTNAYRRSCAVTRERALPVLEAAHIKSYSDGGPHEVNNGLLLRSDMHRLFDKGYITVTLSLHIEVSRRIKDEFDNGEYYLTFHGNPIQPPQSLIERPSQEFLVWHNEKIYKG
jgi:putative restriction endonuclease